MLFVKTERLILKQALGEGVAVEEDVGGVEGHVVPGHVPDAFVGATFAPGIIYQVEWLSVFVYGFAVD